MTNYTNWSKPRRGLILLMALIFALLSMSQVNAKPEKNPDEPLVVSITGPIENTVPGTEQTYTLTFDGVTSTGGVKYTPPSGFTVNSLSPTNDNSDGTTRIWTFSNVGAAGSITIKGQYNSPCVAGSTTHTAEIYDTHNSGNNSFDSFITTVVCPTATVAPTIAATTTVTPTIEVTTTVTPTIAATTTVTPTIAATTTVTPTIEATTTVTPTATAIPTMTPTPEPGTIEGTVFNDLNGDGIQDPGEAGIPGVTVTLEDGTTAITDANGDYSFTNVAAGSHTVTETDPANFTSTTPNQVPVNLISGGTTVANFGDVSQGAISGSVLNVDDTGIAGVTVELLDSSGNVLATATTGPNGGYSFPDITLGTYTVRVTNPDGFIAVSSNPKTVTIGTDGAATATFIYQRTGTISGIVFNDDNGNEKQDSSEAGLADITVTLSNGSTTTTDADGYYQFDNVPASPTASYEVSVDIPNNRQETTDKSVSVSVTAASPSATADFGLVNRSAAGTGTVRGTICNDVDGDGKCRKSENGHTTTVELEPIETRSPDGGGQQVVAGPDGSYVFNNVPVGAYKVKAEISGENLPTTALEVPVSVSDQGSSTVDFGVAPKGTVSGVVFADTDGNGTQSDTETGLSGVGVTLIKDGSEVESTSTNVNGQYQFDNIDSSSSYNVQITEPTGLAATTDINQSIAPGSPANFGLGSTGTLSGVVFRDKNGNKMQDSTEGGLNGAVITLSNGDSMVTNGEGVYEFTGLSAGDYTVTETDPPGFISSSTDNSVQVTLLENDSASANFGDRRSHRIGGVVFNDTNGNGTQDAGEAGFGGATVQLSDGNVISTTTTLGSGAYEFLAVANGDYNVVITAPSGFQATTPVEVSAAVSDSVSPVANFGLQQEQAPTALSQPSLNNVMPTTEPFWLALLLLGTVAGLAFYRRRFVK